MTRRRPSIPNALSTGKRRLFQALIISFPIVILAALEIVLRLVDYGPDMQLFKSEILHGVEYRIMNSGIKDRYFATVPFSPSASPDYFLARKPPGTYRIFFLGGSTTVGYPYWYNGSFSSFLRQHLKAAFPDRRIEVVNVGMTATNSFTTLDVARDLMEASPDLLVVYDGHNEFYGALGVSSRESLGQSRALTNLYLRLLSFRTFVLVRAAIAKTVSLFRHTPEQASRSTLMESLARGNEVPYGSPVYWRAWQSFRDNMRDLVDICRSRGVPVILSTQASNLRGFPPFVSRPLPTTPASIVREIDTLTTSAQANLEHRRIPEGIELAQRARRLDTTVAQPAYILGRLLMAQKDFPAARDAFIAARDLDQLRFRTSSDFNRLILSFSAPPSVFVADVERVFQSHSPDSLIGNELITEHLHPYARGFFLAAGEYARIMRDAGLLAPRAEWERRDTLTEEQLWEMRPVTPLDEIVAKRRADVLTAGWPFKDQWPIVDSAPKDTLSQIGEQTARGLLDWKAAHEAAADFYQRRGEIRNAERELRAIVDQIPLDISGYLSLARILYAEQDLPRLADVLRNSLAVEPTIQAYRTLGDIALQKDDPVGAIAYYERMRTFTQVREERAQNELMLAKAYLAAGQLTQARQATLRILTVLPAYQPAVNLLVEISNRRP